MAGDFGCVGVVVDAKPGVERFCAQFGFFPLEMVEGALQSKPAPTPMFLPLEEIEAATP
jgi:hypothetical protein